MGQPDPHEHHYRQAWADVSPKPSADIHATRQAQQPAMATPLQAFHIAHWSGHAITLQGESASRYLDELLAKPVD